MTAECPSCGTEMDVKSESCPVCLRKRTRQEIFAGMRGERPSKPGGGSRGRALLYGGIGMLAIAYVVMKGPAKPKRPAAPPPPPESRNPQAPTPTPSQEPPQRLAPQPGPTKNWEPPVPDSLVPKKEPASHWTIRGKVFDLLSLKPVPDTAVAFQDTSSGALFKTRSDAEGGYRVVVPKLGGAAYQVTARKRGYKPDHLDDSEPSFMVRDSAARREAAAEMERSAVLHVPLSPPLESDEADFNIVLVALKS